ncbi:Unknown protein [Striga hermonthica]|uniref:F-box domain-containing protein n=1 Tax=Striga hermonthica TaxID=68872 RepID=A0A9N7RBB3_STRHE|nr:Unknown protein [Striga hermonthica]
MEAESDQESAVATNSPAGVMASCNRTPISYFRRRFRFRFRLTNTESLSEDLLFNILIRLPAQDIHDSARLVCHRWAHLTRSRDFIRTHLRRARTGLLIQNTTFLKDLIFISCGPTGRVELSRSRHELGLRILASSHGLVLVLSPSGPCTLRIVNPGTTEYLDLPPFLGRRYFRHGSCLSNVAATNEYKVVQAQFARGLRGEVSYEYAVLTVGTDTSWRHMGKVDRLTRETNTSLLISNPLITEGFVHWVLYSGGSTIFTLDAKTEVMTESRVPVTLGRLVESEYLVSGGKNLTLVVKKLGSFFSWDVWEMSPETQVWRKTIIVYLEEERLKGIIRDRDKKVVFDGNGVWVTPVGWLNFPEVLVFAPGKGRYCILYRVRTREIESIDLPKDAASYNYKFHHSGLVSPTGI